MRRVFSCLLSIAAWSGPLAVLVAPEPVDAQAVVPPESPPVVVVFDVRDDSGTVDASGLEQLSAQIVTQLAQGRLYAVVPREQRRAQLEARQAPADEACAQAACQLELARALGAQKILHVVVARLGTVCAVTGTLTDLQTGAIERDSTQKAACVLEGLVVALEGVAQDLKRGPSGPPASPPVTAGAAAVAAAVAADTVEVAFEERGAAEPWTLHSADGALICTLPCERPVRPASGWYLQQETGDRSDLPRVAVPDALGYPPGARLTATPLPARGNRTLALVGGAVGLASLAGAIPFLVATGTSDDPVPTVDGEGNARVAAGVGWTVASGVVIVAAASLFLWSTDEELELAPRGP